MIFDYDQLNLYHHQVNLTGIGAVGSIEIVSGSRYIVVSADGQLLASSGMPADNALGDGREWRLWDCYFLDDGVMILAAIKTVPN